MKEQIRLFSIFLVISLVLCLVASPAQGDGIPGSFVTYMPAIMNNFTTGLTYQDPVKVSFNPVPTSKQLYQVIDSSGRVHIFWGDNIAIYHIYQTDSGWSSRNKITTPGALDLTSMLSQPVVGKNNDIHLVFGANINNGSYYQVLYIKWDGTQWGPQTALYDHAAEREITGMVTLNNQGYPIVLSSLNVLTDSYNILHTRTFHYQEWNGANFSSMQTYVSPFQTNSREFAYPDPNGGFRMYTFIQNRSLGNFSFRLTTWKNGIAQSTAQVVTIAPDPLYLLMDNQNHLHKFSDGSNKSYFTCIHDNQTVDPAVVISGLSSVMGATKALDDAHSPIYAYSHEFANTVAVQSWNGCQLNDQKEFTLPDLPTNYIRGQPAAVAWNKQVKKVCLLIDTQNDMNSKWEECINLK